MRDDHSFDEHARRMKAGTDDAAFAAFADEAGPWLRRRLMSIGLTPADAEDLAVSVITDVVLRIHKFEPREAGGFRAWVWRVAFNAHVDTRRGRRTLPLKGDQVIPEPDRADEDDDTPALVEAVRQAVDALGEPDGTIIRRKLDDASLTFNELGQAIGMKEGTVRVRHHRAMAKLVDLLKGHSAVVGWQQRRDEARTGASSGEGRP